MPDDIEPDRERTMQLLQALLQPVKDFYLAQGGAGQQHVLEVLNALACATATVIAGTYPNGVGDCLTFFTEAITGQLDASLAALADAAERGKASPEQHLH